MLTLDILGEKHEIDIFAVVNGLELRHPLAIKSIALTGDISINLKFRLDIPGIPVQHPIHIVIGKVCPIHGCYTIAGVAVIGVNFTKRNRRKGNRYISTGYVPGQSFYCDRVCLLWCRATPGNKGGTQDRQ